MSLYADPRPYRPSRRATDVTRLEESRGWLGTQLRSAPWDAPPTRDGASEFATEEACDCGAGEHESCRCYLRGVPA